MRESIVWPPWPNYDCRKAWFDRSPGTLFVGARHRQASRRPVCRVAPPRARISARTRAWPLSLFSDKAQLAHQTQAYVLPHWARISARIRVLGMPALGNMRRKSAFRVMGPSEGAQVAMALFTTTLASTRMRTDASFR